MNKPCPFKVGQRIHEQRSTWVYNTFKNVNVPVSPLEFELDPTKPDATVTVASEKGFTYEYDHPILFGRAAWGEMMIGGDCYPEGYAYWRAVD